MPAFRGLHPMTGSTTSAVLSSSDHLDCDDRDRRLQLATTTDPLNIKEDINNVKIEEKMIANPCLDRDHHQKTQQMMMLWKKKLLQSIDNGVNLVVWQSRHHIFI
mmetsp:Transcript_11081/g.17199  ORF Transcript_11081/g.17199 Transcript_11081/m.17199 type:complete len:105 (-) Transcript_11081:103-417(-)